ncbi:hypothetical protein K6W16_27275 [Burkholderia dolosa]|uniref:Uncharacterized protein n=1 Tax=Burkholderia dolosa TaxID=152500 RepID=A0A892ICZ7_9BURK|nr:MULTISPECIES: hypothetical protein [Burkholderia]MBR8421162.1 hypothetical protein [Burkholderia dolosa]MBY4660760.1 hypothetical protein [Burkholderia dolosa]MBY4691477.1 hypothetical protein [Burkholderia dolosa]MBY4784893.1 hypothetical protein [Burkholderia dolosa]MBY4789356.1 hypothetical protein [Burkholderia dolosa]
MLIVGEVDLRIFIKIYPIGIINRQQCETGADRWNAYALPKSGIIGRNVARYGFATNAKVKRQLSVRYRRYMRISAAAVQAGIAGCRRVADLVEHGRETIDRMPRRAAGARLLADRRKVARGRVTGRAARSTNTYTSSTRPTTLAPDSIADDRDRL